MRKSSTWEQLRQPQGKHQSETESEDPHMKKLSRGTGTTDIYPDVALHCTSTDQGIIEEYDDSTCLNWKEILSLTDVHYKVNSFLLKDNVSDYESFILPKSMYECILRFVDNTNAIGGDHQDMDGNMKKHGEKKMEHAEIVRTNTPKCLREEREAGAHEGGMMEVCNTMWLRHSYNRQGSACPVWAEPLWVSLYHSLSPSTSLVRILVGGDGARGCTPLSLIATTR